MLENNYTMQANAAIKIEGQEAFDALIRFVELLKTDGIDGTRWRTHVEQRKSLEALLDEFPICARVYFDKAQELLSLDTELNESEKARRVSSVLAKLRAHALVLADLVRRPRPKAIPARDLLIQLTSFISLRLKNSADQYNPHGLDALIFPVFSSSFFYVHFAYHNKIGLIGVPAEFIQLGSETLTNKNLTILWHEVASRSVATLQETAEHAVTESSTKENEKSQAGTLADHVNKLRESLDNSDDWGEYRKLYTNTLKYELFVDTRKYNSKLTGAVFDSILEDSVDKISSGLNVDEDTVWQLRWFAEFIEDAFGFIVFGTNPSYFKKALEAMTGALSTTYPSPIIGDTTHPPPVLRALVAVALHYYDPKATNGEMAVNETKYNNAVQVLELPGVKVISAVDIEKKLAYAIAKFINDNAVLDDFYLTANADDWILAVEKRLAAAIFDEQVTPITVSEALGDFPLTADVEAATETHSAHAFQEEIRGANSINALLKIKFIFVDPFGEGEKDTPPVYSNDIPPTLKRNGAS